MFCNENLRHYTRKGKSKNSKIKISSSQTIFSKIDCSKSKKLSKSRKNHKCSKFKNVTAVSDYIGRERLTNHVGVFAKGKTSDSISRLENIMPSEVRARAKQDLSQVLKLTNRENKHRKKYNVKHKYKYDADQSLHSSTNTPHYLYHKTGFASTSWKDKLTKSVGLTSVNSILASVNKQHPETSTNEADLVKGRQALLTKIYPSIKKVNHLMFPNVFNKNKVKSKLLLLKNKLKPFDCPSEHTSVCSSSSEVAQISPHYEIVNECQNAEKEDFRLNPILTGEANDHGHFNNIFPPINNFVEYSDDITSFANSTYLSNNAYEKNEILPSPVTSSIGVESSVALVPSSPTSSDDSPSWKLKISPVKFIPAQVPSPTFYFRHKMF